jgi:hypothetical protein
MRYNVSIQHENFEAKGKTFPNFINVGTVEADDDLAALKIAQELYRAEHTPALVCVEKE